MNCPPSKTPKSSMAITINTMYECLTSQTGESEIRIFSPNSSIVSFTKTAAKAKAIAEKTENSIYGLPKSVKMPLIIVKASEMLFALKNVQCFVNVWITAYPTK